MLNSLLDPYVKAGLPHVRNAGVVALAQCERIVTRLDLILEAVKSAEFEEYHPRFSFTLAVGVPQPITQVPAGEMWELEFVSCSGNAATVTINEGADLFRYAKTFTNADAQPALGLIFGGGTAPTVVANAITQVTMQFKRRQLKPGRKTNAPGMIQSPDMFNGVPYGENDARALARHATLVGYASNVRGAARGDGLVSPYQD